MNTAKSKSKLSYLFFLAAFACLFHDALAQNPDSSGNKPIVGNHIVRGQVKNQEGVTMPYVVVAIDKQQKRLTDKKGNYEFTGLAPGTHTIMFSMLGYDKISKEVQVVEGAEIAEVPEVVLKRGAIEISEVIVYSSPATYSYKYEGSNFVVSSRDIELTKPIGTEEMLKKVSGVNVSGDMGISNRLNVGIRGSYPRRSANILLLEDGTPIAPAPYLAPEAYYNPPTDRLDGIEIMKGADILTFGNNTMYGAVNYITKKPPLKPAFGLNVTGGANGYHSEYVTYGGTWNDIGAELQVLNKGFGGFQDNSQSTIFNTTAKLYADINPRSSVYFKLNYHQEKSKATYSALTPFSFKTDPVQNPFDADDLSTKRYAIDLAYNYKVNAHLVLSTKLYVTQFQRDWWRQENTLIKASTAKSYLGEEIYNDRYVYLEGKTFGADDYVRVGKVTNGKEQTRARNRLFRVGGLQQSVKFNSENTSIRVNAEATVKAHMETFANVEIKNDSSRFARSGTMDKDQFYELAAYSGFIKSKFSYKGLALTPVLRYEWVDMYAFDKIAISKMINNNGLKYFGSQRNTYSSFIPGTTLSYDLFTKNSNKLNIYAGIYKGYTAPIADYGFLNVEDGVVSTPTTDKPINRQPETSLNYEIGTRGDLAHQFINTQVAYFNNRVTNYYSAGRNEAFQTLGSVNIYGLEANLNLNLHKLIDMKNHEFSLNCSATYMQGRVLSGLLKDADLLKAKHTDATKAELVEKINAERDGYDVYFSSTTGKDSLVTRELTSADFSKIKRLDYEFGSAGIANNTVPYLPPFIINVGLNYGFKGFSIGASLNFVSKQYTDYLNFENETAEGAIGSLSAFKTIDANLSYSCEKNKNRLLSACTFFVAAKNIANEVYMASRLHRVSSGIMPGGFRQLNAGIKFNF